MAKKTAGNAPPAPAPSAPPSAGGGAPPAADHQSSIQPAVPGPDASVGYNPMGPESGGTGLRIFSGYVREEWLRELQGRAGMQTLREMLDNDPIIGAIIFAITMLLRGVAFHVEGESDSPDDQTAADFVDSCMGDMEHSFSDFMAVVVSFLPYGFALHEMVFKKRQGQNPNPALNSIYDDGMTGWRKFAPRAQETVLKWEYDAATGDAVSFTQLLPAPDPVTPEKGTMRTVLLRKCLHFTTDRAKGNPQGRGIIRNAYVSYYYKKRIQEIEAVGAERDLTGIPMAKIPAKFFAADATANDKAALAMWKKIVRETSRNEQEGLVIPSAFDQNNNELYTLELLTTAGRRQFDTGAIIDRYDQRIAATVLADFVMLGAQGGGKGSYALSKDKTDLFTVAVTAWLDLITDVFNRRAIPDLLVINNLAGRCHLKHGDVASGDIAVLATALSSLVGSGIILPDGPLEAHVREEMNLPATDQSTLRNVTQQGGEGQGGAAPGQGPPGAKDGGKPGETAPPGQRKPTVGDGGEEDDSPPAAKGPPRAAQKRAITKRRNQLR